MKPYIEPENKMPGSKFFPTGSVNYAENMLSGDTTGPAIIFKSEDKIRKEVSWYELKVQVATLANFLKKQGVVKGDRIAAYMPNMPETVIVMLAASSLGAVFSSASPDFGVDGVLDRFGQIEPKVLLTTDGYWYNGKEVNIVKKVSEIVKALPSLEKVIISPLLNIDTEYNDTNNLSKFGGTIRKSKVTTVIDSAQDSITAGPSDASPVSDTDAPSDAEFEKYLDNAPHLRTWAEANPAAAEAPLLRAKQFLCAVSYGLGWCR